MHTCPSEHVAQLRLTPAARVPGSKSPIAAVMLFSCTAALADAKWAEDNGLNAVG